VTAVGELDDPVVVGFPLEGEWLAARTPAYRIPSHGTDALGLRFAYDLVRTDHRRGFHLREIGLRRELADGALGLVYPDHHSALASEPLGHGLADLARSPLTT
jgi:hypothetical protein